MMIEDQIIDLSYLRQVAGTDNIFIIRMLRVFIEQNAEDLEQLVLHFEKDDDEGIKRWAHKLKPSFHFVGVKKGFDLLDEIETGAGKIEKIEIKHRIDQIKILSQTAIREAHSIIDEMESKK